MFQSEFLVKLTKDIILEKGNIILYLETGAKEKYSVHYNMYNKKNEYHYSHMYPYQKGSFNYTDGYVHFKNMLKQIAPKDVIIQKVEIGKFGKYHEVDIESLFA